MTASIKQPESVEDGVCVVPLGSWKEFLPYVIESHVDDSHFYRGQIDAQWNIISALDRLEKRFPTTPNACGSDPPYCSYSPATRDQHLEAFKEAVRGKRIDRLDVLSPNEWWALAQHHGLATPLLDWTYSPFIALFFAFEEAGYVSVSEETKKFVEPETRAVYVVPFHFFEPSKATQEHPVPEVFSLRREITYRVSSQRGVFMKMPKGEDLESNVRARFAGETTGSTFARAILTKILIPSTGRTDCLRLLDKMNINRMSLFADLDGAARYINELWELDFRTPLGAVPEGVTNNAT